MPEMTDQQCAQFMLAARQEAAAQQAQALDILGTALQGAGRLCPRLHRHPQHTAAAHANHVREARYLRKLLLSFSSSLLPSCEIDHHREFHEAIRLGEFAAAADGLAEITHRRKYWRPKLPQRASAQFTKQRDLSARA
jgi:hypothetical protein